MAFETLKRGSRGNKVKALQYIVGESPDGIFGSKTEESVKLLQKAYRLDTDGVVGRNTFQRIVNDAPILRIGSHGKYVFALESLVTTMVANGQYTADEEAHVKAFQSSAGLTMDGIVGQETWEALFGLKEVVQTGNGKNTTKPVDYKQYSSEFGSIVYTKNNTYNKNQTIRNSGCGVTAMADIVATWWDKNITPKEMAALSVKNGYRTENSGTAWGFFGFVAKRYNARKFIQTDSFTTMQNCLVGGGYVIVSFRPSKWTNGG